MNTRLEKVLVAKDYMKAGESFRNYENHENIDALESPGLWAEAAKMVLIEEYFKEVYGDINIRHAPGSYQQYLDTKTSAGWGCLPLTLGSIKVSYIILSPWHKGDSRVLLYDYIEK